jgi:glycosyltransferase involved in cell wall biosynthesis
VGGVKILVVGNLYPPDTVGGYELGCRQVVDALRARGHDVRVLTSAPRTPVPTPPHVHRRLKLADLWDYYTEARSRPISLRMKELEAFQISAFNVHALLGALEEFEPDVVYAWMLVGLGGLGLMGCLEHLRVPWVWHLMDEVPSKLCTVDYAVNPALASEFSRRIRGRFLACSRQLVDAIERKGVALGDEVALLPNWVTGPRPAPRAAYYREGTLRIAAAAAVIDRNYDKGIDLLICAAGALLKTGRTNFSIDIFGKVVDAGFGDLIRTLNLSDHVTLKGPREQSEFLDALGDYDVFAFPGRTDEPFGFAPLEALSRGCVPVVSWRCGVAEWLVHGVHCLKATRQPGAFADAIRQVLDGTVNLAGLGPRGETAVWRDFHLETLVPRIENELCLAASSPRVGAGTPEEAYRLAVLAEKVSGLLVQETFGT